MSNWVDDLGTVKFDEKDIVLLLKMFRTLAEVSDSDSLELKTSFINKLDNCVYNVTAIRDAVKKDLHV